MSAPVRPVTPASLASHRAVLQRLRVDGGELAYLDLGPRDGSPVLLVHGIPTSSWLFRTIAARLAADGLRVIAPDLLGYGASSKPAGRDLYSPRRQSDRLVALLEHLSIPAATFVVHDAGGPWAFEVADRHPQRLAGLVVLNTTAYGDAFRPPRNVQALGGPLGPAMLALMRTRLGKKMVHSMLSGLTHTGKGLSPSVTEPHWLALREGGTVALRAFAQDLKPFIAAMPRYAAALRRLDVPAAIVWGADDPVLRAERLVHRFATDLKVAPADIHVLPAASHFLQEDQPGDIADVIARFVNERVATRAR